MLLLCVVLIFMVSLLFRIVWVNFFNFFVVLIGVLFGMLVVFRWVWVSVELEIVRMLVCFLVGISWLIMVI